MARLPNKLAIDPFMPENFLLRESPSLQKYNSYRMVTYTPLTLSQKVQVAAFSEPSRVVGGDFYEVFQLDQQKMAIIIADVCGKGLAAAKMVLHIQGLIKQQIDQCLPMQMHF